MSGEIDGANERENSLEKMAGEISGKKDEGDEQKKLTGQKGEKDYQKILAGKKGGRNQ